MDEAHQTPSSTDHQLARIEGHLAEIQETLSRLVQLVSHIADRMEQWNDHEDRIRNLENQIF